MIEWEKGTKEEHELASQIAKRFISEMPEEKTLAASVSGESYKITIEVEPRVMPILMDIIATHTSGCKLKLKELLEADLGDFLHDICGINKHLDRDTGELGNCFLPRYAAKVLKTTEDKIKWLTAKFAMANRAALQADPGQDKDGGTCNLDNPAFRVAGMRKTTIEKAASKLNMRVTDFQWLGGQRWYWLGTARYGQADRRAAMAMAAAEVLTKAAESMELEGFEACCYMAMD